MIEKLPKWNLHSNRPSFYDTDSVTMLELASRLHGAMNELIDDQNKTMEELSKGLSEFIIAQAKELEEYKTAMRQEFQDFIDVVNLKIAELESKIQ